MNRLPFIFLKYYFSISVFIKPYLDQPKYYYYDDDDDDEDDDDAATADYYYYYYY